MLWIDKISELKDNYNMKNKKYEYFYETSCYKDEKSIFKQKFIRTNNLPKKQDYTSFLDYIKKSKNKYVTSFYNLSKSAILVIPIPKKNKNFCTLNEFCKNASITHQIKFWKKVASEIKKYKKNNEKVYLSTHGLGIPYLHIRIENTPKYYTSKLR